MFAPETEDMLPRAAPKPTKGSEQIEATIKPTVPEVSLLFGQQTPSVSVGDVITNPPIAPKQPQTYASWRKQTLPRVTFPANLVTELGAVSRASSCDSNSSRSSSCGTITTPTINSIISSASAPNLNGFTTTTSCSPATSAAVISNCPTVYDQLEEYRRNYEKRCCEHPSNHFISKLPQRRSLDDSVSVLHNRITARSEVLTICASTQTDAAVLGSQPLLEYNNLATKNDLVEMHQTLQQMQENQLRILQFCEALLHQSQYQQQVAAVKTTCCKEMGTQCEILASNNAATNNKQASTAGDFMTEENEVNQMATEMPITTTTHNQFKNNAAQFQTPRGTPPAAQSTGYRANTPQQIKLNTGGAVLPKPNTEKSLAMNELALKYLPQDKLHDLLQEFRITPINNDIAHNKQPPPLRAIENYDKSPSDISNASYKYLKKYRLLPEDQLNYHRTPSPQRQQHQRRYDTQSPVNGRNGHTQYQPRTNSPLIAEGHRSPIIDLENIRNQPKLL